ALRARRERDLCLHRRGVVRIGNGGLDVDKGAQTLVLAEVAARGFVAGRGIGDGGNALKADELGLFPVLPQAHGLEGTADGSGFTAVLVADHFRLYVFALEAR